MQFQHLFPRRWVKCVLFRKITRMRAVNSFGQFPPLKKCYCRWLDPAFWQVHLPSLRTDVLSQMSQWVLSHESISQIWKTKSFGRNNKIKHYFYLICLLASLLPAHARPISDMKSQLGLFVSSIPGPAATVTYMPRKIAFPDTLQEPFKPSDNPYYYSFHTRSEVLPQGCLY